MYQFVGAQTKNLVWWLSPPLIIVRVYLHGNDMIYPFVFEEIGKGNILSLLYIMMLCSVFINKHWKKCFFFLNWKLAVKYLTHWKSNSLMNNKLNSNHPEVMANLLYNVFLKNIHTVKDFIQCWFLFLPLNVAYL